MGTPGVNAKELVEQLWRDVKAQEQVQDLTDVPTLPSRDSTADNATLRTLNVIWDVPAPQPPPATSSLKGKARHRAATFILNLLRPYFDDQQQFRARTVQMLNTLSLNDDAVTDEIRQLATALRLESQRLTDRAELLHRLLENRVASLEDHRSESQG